MAFRLERDESVIDGLRRVVREELKSAAGLLAVGTKTNRDEAIHEARKSVKKVRAVLRLAYPGAEGEPSRENERLRDIASRLSEFRDAAVIVETFDNLKKHCNFKRAPAGSRAIRAALVRRLRESGGERDVAAVLHEASASLLDSWKRMKTWVRLGDGFDALAPGIGNTYRSGRKALAKAQRERSPENLHDLRKRIKDHWYHVRLLEGVWSEMMAVREKSLKDLETWLGEDHNLFVLTERISAEPSSYGKEKHVKSSLQLIAAWQMELREKALPLAERLYEEKPREFTRHMKHLWETWQSGSDPTPDAVLREEADAPGPSLPAA